MDEKPKALFLLFEGLAATVIESQVLANVRLLQDRGVAAFEVWAFACLPALLKSSRNRQQAATELAQAPVKVFRGVRPLTVLAYLVNVLLVAWRLFPRRREFTHIHARTDYSAAVAGPVAHFYGLELIWDCRGDSSAEVAERFGQQSGPMALLISLRIRELSFYARVAARYCTTALFVTDELRDIHRHLLATQPTAVIPCAAHEDLFHFDLALRTATRQRLGYGDTETVYVYSGSLTGYQCFGETVALFESLHRWDANSRLLVLTPAVAQARMALAGLPSGCCQVHACSLREVNAYLNAADIGFLLRQRSRTNHVAFPTKFAEYGLTGLAVITSEALPAVYRLAAKIGNLASVSVNSVTRPPTLRAEVARQYLQWVSRGAFVDAYRRIYLTRKVESA